MEVHIVQKKNEAIPACITNLKALKALYIINFEQPNPIITESINSFIGCLKNSINFTIIKSYPIILSYDFGN